MFSIRASLDKGLVEIAYSWVSRKEQGGIGAYITALNFLSKNVQEN